MTKRENGIYNSYVRSNTHSLFKAYVNPSLEKKRAWWYCRDLRAKFGGYGLKVIGYNCFMFSAAFLFDKDGETYLMYITKDHDKAFRIK